MNNPILYASNISYSYKQGNVEIPVLKDISISLTRCEKIAIVGPSGSGKSTFLYLLGLLDSIQSGEIEVNGKKTSKMNDNERTAMRMSQIGFVYQYHHLFKGFSALENVMIPQMIAGIPKNKATDRANELLEMVGLYDRKSHFSGELSGGQQQRVAIARALANSPKILLADEPTGNLDEQTASEVFALIEKITKNEGLSVIMATHNIALCKKVDKVIKF